MHEGFSVPLNLTRLYSLFDFLRLELYPRYPGSVVSIVTRHMDDWAPPLRKVRRTRYKIDTWVSVLQPKVQKTDVQNRHVEHQ